MYVARPTRLTQSRHIAVNSMLITIECRFDVLAGPGLIAVSGTRISDHFPSTDYIGLPPTTVRKNAVYMCCMPTTEMMAVINCTT